MMKNIIFLGGVAGIIFTGCAPTIVSVKSPMNMLDEQKCFNLPNKEYLSKSPIYKQKIYQLTENTLKKNNINAVYGNSDECKNYLMTDWIITTGKESVTYKGTTTTNTYGNIYKNSYNANSYSYTTPDATYQYETYRGTYTLEIGKINDDSSLAIVWEGTQSGQLSSNNLESAQKVSDENQGIIDTMVEKMLFENNIIK